MSRFLKIEDNDSLVKDTKTKAVLNNNLNELQAYKARKRATQAQGTRLDNLEKDMSEIKDMLQTIVKGMK